LVVSCADLCWLRSRILLISLTGKINHYQKICQSNTLNHIESQIEIKVIVDYCKSASEAITSHGWLPVFYNRNFKISHCWFLEKMPQKQLLHMGGYQCFTIDILLISHCWLLQECFRSNYFTWVFYNRHSSDKKIVNSTPDWILKIWKIFTFF